MSNTRARVKKIRARLDHPILDSDGHDIEYLPLVREELRALARQGAVDRFELMVKVGLSLHALFGSDIGHWDVPEIDHVLLEAWELVEAGIVAEEDFRRFAFTSPVAFWTANNPRFFDGTLIAEAVAKERCA